METTRKNDKGTSWGEMLCYKGHRRLLKGGKALDVVCVFPMFEAGVEEEYERG